jgi:hypothetical protein
MRAQADHKVPSAKDACPTGCGCQCCCGCHRVKRIIVKAIVVAAIIAASVAITEMRMRCRMRHMMGPHAERMHKDFDGDTKGRWEHRRGPKEETKAGAESK